MAIDLVKNHVKVEAASHTCIVANLASLEGGVVLNLVNAGLPEDVKVLRAGHPVAQCEDGSWQPCTISARGEYEDFNEASPKHGFGVLAHDVPVDNPVAAIMLVGVVDCAKSPVPFSASLDDYDYRFGGITFINVPVE